MLHSIYQLLLYLIQTISPNTYVYFFPQDLQLKCKQKNILNQRFSGSSQSLTFDLFHLQIYTWGLLLFLAPFCNEQLKFNSVELNLIQMQIYIYENFLKVKKGECYIHYCTNQKKKTYAAVIITSSFQSLEVILL